MSSFVVTSSPAYAMNGETAENTADAITVKGVYDRVSNELYLTLFDADGDNIRPSRATVATPPFPGLPAQVVINLPGSDDGGAG